MLRSVYINGGGSEGMGYITSQLQSFSFKIAIIIIYFGFIKSPSEVFLETSVFLKNAANLQDNIHAEV